ncbi:MAG: ABC transporter ATP-binding protein [Geminicoccaceae bacterium]
MTELTLTGLVKRYGRITALDGLSLDVRAGEFYCLLGPSAAGKTTTLRAISGLEPLEAGKIEFAGCDVTTAPVQGRGIAMIFQTFALYPHLSVRENLAYPLREAKVASAEIKRRVGEVAELLRITHTLDRKTTTASGGEQQRIAIGRALVRRPKLLLLDEPLTNLDAKLRHDMRAEFKRLHRDLGTTMLYATPDQLEALTMGQRIAVMREGRIVEVGSPQELYVRPRDAYAARMVGAPAINLMPGRIQLRGGTRMLELPFGEIDLSGVGAGLEGGASVLAGVRPHDINLAPGQGPVFQGSVRLTEPLGDITVLDLDLRGVIVKMVLPEDRALAIKPGQPVEVVIAAQNLHLFDRDTGRRID